jgi:hypothetical protein
LISENPEKIIVIFIQVIYKIYSSVKTEETLLPLFQFCRVLVNRRNGTTNAESYPQLTSYSRTQNSRRSAFGSPLGSHPELRYLKGRREIFQKRTERREVLAAVDDLNVQVMPSIGGKTCTFYRQELP